MFFTKSLHLLFFRSHYNRCKHTNSKFKCQVLDHFFFEILNVTYMASEDFRDYSCLSSDLIYLNFVNYNLLCYV